MGDSVHFFLHFPGDRPQAAVIQTPPGPLWFTGETVYTGDRLTLTCTVDGDSTGWKYLWYKDTQGVVLSNTDSDRTDGSSYTINSAAPSHSGQYWCRAHRGGFYSHYSDSHEVNIQEIQITMESCCGKISTGDTLTLRCTLKGSSTGWKYLWYKDARRTELSNTDSDRTDGSSYTISSAAPSHSGQYWCRAHRGGFYSHYSDSHKVNIQGEDLMNNLPTKGLILKSESPVCCIVTAIFTFPGVPQPVLSLQSGWTNMFPTETVTLSCDVQGSSTRWVYKWYRDGQEIPISGDGDTYTILSAARSHSGQYQCRGELPERAVTSPHSHSLNLTVYGTVLLSYFVFMLRCSAMFLLC
uniref:Ig-like domain-containing protein n=1 Tax=Scleropages formosus TaxID=113540 RepID=A0A8C9TCW4_SCLFO